MTCYMRNICFTLAVLFYSPFSLSIIGTVASARLEVPKNFVKHQSDKVEAKVDPKIETRFSELQNVLPNSSPEAFLKGEMFVNQDGLVWKNLRGREIVLVRNSRFEEGFKISGFSVSPDGLKVAYYTTFQGQDLKFWNAMEIHVEGDPILKDPVENRMQGFSWNSTSDGFYYSFWHSKEDVRTGKKPIVETRFQSLKTGMGKTVFDHKKAENFEIADLDGGKTLLAYRILNPAAGIKTTFSMYKGVLKRNGTYKWSSVYPRNQHVGVFLGVFNGKAIIQTSGEGNTYGVSSVDVLSGKRAVIETLVPARRGRVLHTAEVARDRLILQYHTIPHQNVSLDVMNLSTKRIISSTSMASLGLTPYGNLTRFLFSPGAEKDRAVFSDVYRGKVAIEMNHQNGSLELLRNRKDIDFDARQVEEEFFEFTAADGRRLTGRIYKRKGEDPGFAFMRSYGWISIKNSPEPREMQMALELGGVYVILDMPGGGEKGAEWFIDGSRNRLKMVGYIDEARAMIEGKFPSVRKKVVSMGRSWGGLTHLVLAALYGKNFAMINPIVPILDLEDMLTNGWFGRIAHSDLAPFVDRNGDYILNYKFWKYVRSINPMRLLGNIGEGQVINLLTNGLDDRVDQGGEQEAEFAFQLSKQLGEGEFNYHRSIQGNHSNRYYQVLMFSIIKEHFGLEYRPIRK